MDSKKELFGALDKLLGDEGVGDPNPLGQFALVQTETDEKGNTNGYLVLLPYTVSIIISPGGRSDELFHLMAVLWKIPEHIDHMYIRSIHDQQIYFVQNDD